jgi:Holliday junction resolvasome RuvABC endonuclease subunit
MQVRRHAHLLLTGEVLSIDPSVGSIGSQPGYAWWSQGKKEDSGIIQLGTSKTADIPARLHHLRMTLETEFPRPDLVVVERIVLNAKARGYCNPSVLKLNQAIGVVMSQWGVPVIEVSPMSWKASSRSLPFELEKSDENDSIKIGWCVMEKAREIVNE